MAESIDSYSDIEDDTDDAITELFNKATNHAKTLAAKLESQTLLKLYSYYKQAIEGPCNIPRPRWYEMQAKAKWDAWDGLRNMPQEEAKQRYIDLVTELDPGFSQGEKTAGWVSVSTHVKPDNIDDSEKNIFDYVKDGDLNKIKSILKSDIKILEAIDDDGMGLIHWTADRGDINILKYLIDMKVDINLLDQDGQTALHYAVSCDHVDCVKLLIDQGADVRVKDNDGLAPKDLTTNSKILELLCIL